MRYDYFKNVRSMIRNAVWNAIEYEESFIDVHLNIKGVWGDENNLCETQEIGGGFKGKNPRLEKIFETH